MVREFEHDSFTDLKVLQDDDPEKDFFENIKHIQVWEKKYLRQDLSTHFQDEILLVSADILVHVRLLPNNVMSTIVFDSLSEIHLSVKYLHCYHYFLVM